MDTNVKTATIPFTAPQCGPPYTIKDAIMNIHYQINQFPGDSDWVRSIRLSLEKIEKLSQAPSGPVLPIEAQKIIARLDGIDEHLEYIDNTVQEICKALTDKDYQSDFVNSLQMHGLESGK